MAEQAQQGVIAALSETMADNRLEHVNVII